MWREIASRDLASFTLPPSYLYLSEGDRVTITEGGSPITVRLTKVTRGANGVIECEGIVELVVNTRRSSEVLATPSI